MGMFGSARAYTPTLNALARMPLVARNGGPGSVRDPLPNALGQQMREYHANPADRARNALASVLQATGQMPGEARSTAENVVAFTPLGAADDLNSGMLQTGRGVAKGSKPETLGGILAMALAGAPIPSGVKKEAKAGIRAFHGSPHDFEKFSLSKIGTGEGAQAFGHGLYFAESEDVARSYRDALAAPSSPINDAASEWIRDNRGDQQAAARAALEYGRAARLPQSEIDALQKAILQRGHMYEVNINADPNSLLDWDAWVEDQADIADRIIPNRVGHAGQLYQDFADSLGRFPGDPAGRVAAAKEMARRGVPGIKYFDQGSRKAGDGTRNYVIFDDSLINILRKYGLAGTLMAGTTAAALSQQQQKPGM